MRRGFARSAPRPCEAAPLMATGRRPRATARAASVGLRQALSSPKCFAGPALDAAGCRGLGCPGCSALTSGSPEWISTALWPRAPAPTAWGLPALRWQQTYIASRACALGAQESSLVCMRLPWDGRPARPREDLAQGATGSRAVGGSSGPPVVPPLSCLRFRPCWVRGASSGLGRAEPRRPFG